jgi:DNA (cytosine-5)-methyltransferase 1
MGYEITDEQRDTYRQTSARSRRRKVLAQEGGHLAPVHSINEPRFAPMDLMPRLAPCGLRSLSLFSGGGGLDLGFDLAGFAHAASFEILQIGGATLSENRPDWRVFAGSAGDVTKVDWTRLDADDIHVIHGGPPCQPFSVAGHRRGRGDHRDMWPEFVRAVQTLRPDAFVAENVPGLIQAKFAPYVEQAIMRPLGNYRIRKFVLNAADFGVPQMRQRVFFVGFAAPQVAARFIPPQPTHSFAGPDLFALPPCIRVREALGLPDIGFDDLCPTLRSGFTGPRKTTGVINSKASLERWAQLEIWPHGVAASRLEAHRFPPENGHFRLAVQDCALIQGFPDTWHFAGAVYQVLGQIGNSVAPPIAYRVAAAVREALLGCSDAIHDGAQS